MTTYTFEIKSDVAASSQEVWRQATDMRAVNRELRPLLRMTYPAPLRDLNVAATPLRHRLFRSWVLLFGVLPIDYYDVTIVHFEPERRFIERSTTLHYRLWRHERVLEPIPCGVRIKDRVVIRPRVGYLGPLLYRFVRVLFERRHKNLRDRYGEGMQQSSTADREGWRGVGKPRKSL